MSTPFEQQQVQEQVVADRAQLHDEQGDVWARHAGSPRDRAADAAVRAEIAAEAHGEYDENGEFRPSTWGSAW